MKESVIILNLGITKETILNVMTVNHIGTLMYFGLLARSVIESETNSDNDLLIGSTT